MFVIKVIEISRHGYSRNVGYFTGYYRIQGERYVGHNDSTNNKLVKRYKTLKGVVKGVKKLVWDNVGDFEFEIWETLNKEETR